MTQKESHDLRDILTEAHAFFFLLGAHDPIRLNLFEIRKDGLVIETPQGSPMRSTILGYIPKLDGRGIYEIEGNVDAQQTPPELPHTIFIRVDPNLIILKNRRIYPRYNFSQPVEGTLFFENRKDSLPIHIENISAGGLRVECIQQLEIHATYLFSFEIELEDEIHDLELRGKIVYEHPSKYGHSYGVQFVGTVAEVEGKEVEVSIKQLDRTIDLMRLVNKLFIQDQK
jgi:hypothetical protein